MSEASQIARAKVLSLTIDVVHRSDRWPELCDALCEALGGTAFMVFEYDFKTFTSPIFRGSDAVARAMHLVEATMEGKVPDVEIAGYQRFFTFPSGRLVGEFECYDIEHDRDLPENPYRDAVLAATGAGSRSVMRLNDIGPWSDVAALHLKYPAAEMPAALRAEAELLMPLVGRAIDAARTLSNLSRINSVLMDAFDRLDFGAAICDASGRIVISNAEFRCMAADQDGLADQGGAIRSTHSSDRGSLISAIRAALDARTSASLHVCRLSRRSGRLPLIARAIPIRGVEIGRSASALVLLLVVDPEATDRVNADGIHALGVLSQAELDVCRMVVDGHSTAEIAERRGTSAQTATDQIKSALAKLSCATRLDIVRLAMATRPPGKA